MKPEDQPPIKIRQVVFEPTDLFDKERIVKKIDGLIHAWGQELVQKGYLEEMPLTDAEWLSFLDMDIYWGDLKDQWEHYIVGCLTFFVLLRADIKRDFGSGR